jgi:hypothetical protein
MNLTLIWLLFLAIFIFGLVVLTDSSNKQYKIIEGLSLDSATSIVSTDNFKGKPKNTSSDSTSGEFKYFKMLPPDNKWSQKTIDAFKSKLKEIDSKSPELTDEGLNMYMKFGSEQEAKIFIETGKFPMNDFIINNLKLAIKNDPNTKEEDKEKRFNEFLKLIETAPASLWIFHPMFRVLVDGKNIPQDFDNLTGNIKFWFSGNKLKVDGDSLLCAADGIAYLNNAQKGNEITDFTKYEKLPGFKFLDKPCNPCGFSTPQCKFSYEDVINPQYKAYWGISSTSGKANPATVMDDAKYKKCFEKANGRIVDLGGEPIDCQQ